MVSTAGYRVVVVQGVVGTQGGAGVGVPPWGGYPTGVGVGCTPAWLPYQGTPPSRRPGLPPARDTDLGQA